MTLVEVSIALFIFGICIAGMCTLLVSVKETSDRARDHYVAINLAKNRIERAKAFEFEQIPVFAENGTTIDSSGAPSQNGRFRRTTSVVHVATNLVEMTLVVAIRNRETLAFGTENEELKTYVAKMQGPPE